MNTKVSPKLLFATTFGISDLYGQNMSMLCLQLVSAALKWPQKTVDVDLSRV